NSIVASIWFTGASGEPSGPQSLAGFCNRRTSLPPPRVPGIRFIWQPGNTCRFFDGWERVGLKEWDRPAFVMDSFQSKFVVGYILFKDTDFSFLSFKKCKRGMIHLCETLFQQLLFL